MESIACIVGGICLVGCGIALSYLRPPDWSSDGDLLDDPRRSILRWATVQRWVRLANNSLVALIGVTIFSAAFIPHGRVWIIVWLTILVLLLVCLLFAILDAFSSMAGYHRALPEAARRSFLASDEEDTSP